jgi:lipopolysaccharide/colanic/teichoic acid biosynthesis glycosyltransferase
VKFRTMTDTRTATGEPSDERQLPLRAVAAPRSLDELPGGERAARTCRSSDRGLPSSTWRCTARASAVTTCAQITGWTGGCALTWDEKFAHDVWYVDHRSFRLDAAILARTVKQVVSGHGVSAPGHATMEPFRGSGSSAAGDGASA